MKVSLVVLATLSAGLLSACTGVEHKTAYVAPQQVSYPNGVKVETDTAYIAAVERIARRRGITLQWVNLPVKRTVVSEQ